MQWVLTHFIFIGLLDISYNFLPYLPEVDLPFFYYLPSRGKNAIPYKKSNIFTKIKLFSEIHCKISLDVYLQETISIYKL